MVFGLIMICIVVLCLIAGKYFYDMPNPGTRFYERINGNGEKEAKESNSKGR